MTDRKIITIALCAFVAVGSIVVAFAAQSDDFPIISARGGETREHRHAGTTSTSVAPATSDAASEAAPAVTNGGKNSSGAPKPTTTTRRGNSTNLLGNLLAPTGRAASTSRAL